jgi:hypothetical protein
MNSAQVVQGLRCLDVLGTQMAFLQPNGTLAQSWHATHSGVAILDCGFNQQVQRPRGRQGFKAVISFDAREPLGGQTLGLLVIARLERLSHLVWPCLVADWLAAHDTDQGQDDGGETPSREAL